MKDLRQPFGDKPGQENPRKGVPNPFTSPLGGHGVVPPIPPPPHANGGIPPLPPEIRSGIAKVLHNDTTTAMLDSTYGDALDYVQNIIDCSPVEIKLTLAMLLGFPVDLSGCTLYAETYNVPDFPLFNSVAKKALSNLFGEENLANVLFGYNTSPKEQALIAITVAMLQNPELNYSDSDVVDDLYQNIDYPAPPVHPHHAPPAHGIHTPHHGDVLPPHVRDTIVKALFDATMQEKLEGTYGNALDFVFDIIDRAPAEIKLTLSMLLGFKVDLTECTQYVSKPVKFTSALFNKLAKEAMGNIIGEANLKNALFIYNTCPAEQALIAVTVALMMQRRKLSSNNDEVIKQEGESDNGSAENDS